MRAINIDYEMMARAGFRMILVGIESANQKTLDRLNKGRCVEDNIKNVKRMAEAGLEPHGSFMTGYPWETEEDEKKTIKLCHELLKAGWLKTAQVSVYSYPQTKPHCNSPGHKYLKRFYDIYHSPRFWITKLLDLKKWEDFTYLFRGAKLILEEKWRKRS